MRHKKDSIVKLSRCFLIVRVAKYPKQNFCCCRDDSTRVGLIKPLENITYKSLRKSAFNKCVFDGVTLSAVQTFFIFLNTEFE